MTVENAAVEVTDERVIVSGTSSTGQSVWIQNTGPDDVTLGGPEVAVGEAPALAPGGETAIDLQRASDVLWGVCATGETATLLTLRVAE